MTELDTAEAQLLEQARRGLRPTLADRNRIAQGLQARLAATGASPRGPNRLDSAAGGVARWVGLSGLLALGGALGYWQGYRAGAENRAVVTVVRSAPAAVSVAQPIPQIAERPPLAAPRESSRSRATIKSTRAASPSAASAEAAHPTEPLGLDEEVRQLRRVEKAIREDNPRFARVLLDELDGAIPTGQLLEERTAASLMANCQLAAPSAKDDAQAFTTRHARSAYVARVLEICGLPGDAGQRIPSAAGTSVPR